MQTKTLITLFGKKILGTYVHYIMRLDYGKMQGNQRAELKMHCITDNPEKMIDAVFTKALSEKITKQNQKKCDEFIFSNVLDEIVGTVSVMYRDGNDIEYRIRNIDAFIYNVYTIASERGKGYAGSMIRLLMEMLHEKGIDQAYLCVRTNNESAIRAYQKLGFVTEGTKCFIRFMGINIPYHIL